MKLTNCIITDNGISTVIEGRPYSVGKDHLKYKEILKTLKSKDGDKFIELYLLGSKSVKIKESSGFKVSSSLVVGYENITWNGTEIRNSIVEKILRLQKEGQDVGPISLFLEKTLSLSKENAEALFLFVESKGLPISEDGDLLAWKVVNSNYKDKHTGKVDNSVGVTVPEIPRSLCDSSRENPCSLGYHVGNLAYSGPQGTFQGSGDKTVIVKFNPSNVVSVPSDVRQNKIRVTQYTVVEDYKPENMVKMEQVTRNLTIESLKHGDKVVFITKDGRRKPKEVVLKFEGVSKRSKCTSFYGRILKGSTYGIPGQSASFVISNISNLKKVENEEV